MKYTPISAKASGRDFVPRTYDMKYVDVFEQVTDKDAAIMARRMQEEGPVLRLQRRHGRTRPLAAERPAEKG